ncbi:MAG: alpha-keto acid decarboxylase family protein [Paraclostridium sp.]
MNIIEKILSKDITISQYLCNKLYEIGIKEVFGVPGDYNFPIIDTMEKDKDLNFINCCNELNAGYAADGYARVNGASALITTFGVGELSTLNTIAGAYAENVPIIHIVGSPNYKDQMGHKIMHHTLLNGDFDVFHQISSKITQATAVITKENAKQEIDRVVYEAITKKKPVYILLAKDICSEKIIDKGMGVREAKSDEKTLEEAISKATSFINNSKNPVIISGLGVSRYKISDMVIEFCEKLNSPITTMLTGKGSIDEQHPNYIGIYCGSLINEQTRSIVESSDCIINIDEPLGDMNCGAFTAKLNPSNMIVINGDSIQIGMAKYEKVLIKDVIEGIMKNVNRKQCNIVKIKYEYDEVPNKMDSNLSCDYYYPIFQKLIKDGDTVVVENGTLLLGFSQVKLPSDIIYISQAQWGSIGYATASTLGAGIASKNRRLILFTGEGGHQLTVQAIGTMLRNGLKPIIFVLNNDGYTIERYLNTQKDSKYNYLPKWDYTLIPKAFGEDAFVARIKTNEELSEVINKIENENRMCYIELVGDMMDVSTLSKAFGEMANKKK